MSRKTARLKPKKVKGRIQVLKVMPYRGSMIYIRRITSKSDSDIFEYMLVFKKEIYSSYMIISPAKGKKSLTKDEISQATELLWAGSEATIDTLMGDTLEKKKSEVVDAFEGSRDSVERLVN